MIFTMRTQTFTIPTPIVVINTQDIKNNTWFSGGAFSWL